MIFYRKRRKARKIVTRGKTKVHLLAGFKSKPFLAVNVTANQIRQRPQKTQA